MSEENEFYYCYSLTNKEVDKMYEWQKSHNKKFHKKGFGYQGVSPVSNFEVRFGSCSIGTWADCVCLKCLDDSEKIESPKKAEKMRKFAIHEIRGLE